MSLDLSSLKARIESAKRQQEYRIWPNGAIFFDHTEAQALVDELEKLRATTFNGIFHRVTSELPDDTEIRIYVGPGDIGMTMWGSDSENLGEFSDGVMPDVQAAVLEALKICCKRK